MKHIKRLGLCLVVVFALSAVASATASAAEPELVNTKGEALVKKNFSAKGGAGELTTKSNGAIKCKEAKAEGEVTGLKTAKSTTTFSGCEFSGIKCNTTGAKEGLIVTPLEGRLVYEVVKATLEPAFLFKVTNFTIECTALQKLAVEGEILVLITPAKKLQKTLELIAIEKGPGEVETTEYEETKGGGVKKLTTPLTTTGTGLKKFKEVSAEVTTATLTFLELVELRA